jgi:hypothetical protein
MNVTPRVFGFGRSDKQFRQCQDLVFGAIIAPIEGEYGNQEDAGINCWMAGTRRPPMTLLT